MPRELEFFSLGGLIGLAWKPRRRIFPWIGSALLLLAVGCWSLTTAAGRVDFLLMASLAGYELIIGLTQEPVVP